MQSEIYDAFIEAGISEPKARAAAEAVITYPKPDELATKADLKAEIAELEARLTWRMTVSTGIIIIAIGALAIFN